MINDSFLQKAMKIEIWNILKCTIYCINVLDTSTEMADVLCCDLISSKLWYPLELQ